VIDPAEELTADEVREHVTTDWWILRNCTLCAAPIGYYFPPDKTVFWDGSCDCVPDKGATERTWEDIANLLNSVSPEMKEQMMRELVGEKTERQL
jgi:hypothetical protein